MLVTTGHNMMVHCNKYQIVVKRSLKYFLFVYPSDVYVATASSINRATRMG